MRSLIITFFSLLATASFAADTYSVVADVCVNLRERPTQRSKSLKCIEPGEGGIQVLKETSRYSYVQVGNQKGYMWHDSIGPAPRAAIPAKTAVPGVPAQPASQTGETIVESAPPFPSPNERVQARAKEPSISPPEMDPAAKTQSGQLLGLAPKGQSVRSDRSLAPWAPERGARSTMLDQKNQDNQAISSAGGKSLHLHGRGVCNFSIPLMKQNCETVMEKVESGELPREATLYALKTFKETFGLYCDGKEIKNKVRNDCSFFFSNLDGVYEDFAHRSPAYLIDLCAGDSKRSNMKEPVTSTFVNRGTGSKGPRSKASYNDKDGAGTTLAGVFRTGELTGFVPYKKSRSKYAKGVGYKHEDPDCEGSGNYSNRFLAKCNVIRVELERVGGSRSGSDKPMHTSPFKSSSGCPSMPPSQNFIMRHLASRGTSLYIAYTSQKDQAANFQAPARYCEKDPDKLESPFGKPLDRTWSLGIR